MESLKKLIQRMDDLYTVPVSDFDREVFCTMVIDHWEMIADELLHRCQNCHGSGIDQEWGTDHHPEPKCRSCAGTGEE